MIDTKAIEAELAAIRPGPWECDHESWAEIDDISVWSASRGEDGKHDEIICNIGGPIVECVENLQSLADGRFIANAPTHVRNLLARVKELEDENIGLRFAYGLLRKRDGRPIE